MSSSKNRPEWWQVYLTFPLLIVLFVLDARLKISTRGHQAVQIGIVLLVYGLIHLWLKANSSALARMDRRQEQGRIRAVRIPISQLPEAEAGRRPMFELPASEVKGMLSDTFEIDYIDAESFPVDEVSQELKKE
jgi:hypothetical protein